MANHKMTCLSLFSGIGAFDLAASWVGVQTTQMVEINPFCQKVLRKNFPGIPIHDDITTYSAKPGSFDFIAGGPPCQGFSVAGQKQGFSDDRSILFFEFTRLVKEVQPLGFIIENVPGIYDWMPEIIQALAEVGNYHCFWFSLSVAQLGGCHWRNRWFCVGVSADPESQRSKCTESQALQEGKDQAFSLRDKSREKESLSRVRREDDGVPSRMDRSRLMTREEAWSLIYKSESCDARDLPNRNRRIKALGNSVTPQQYCVAWLTLFQLLEKNKYEE